MGWQAELLNTAKKEKPREPKDIDSATPTKNKTETNWRGEILSSLRKSGYDATVYRTKKAREMLEKDIGFETISDDLAAMNVTVNGIYKNWHDKESMSSTKSSVENMYNRLNAYEEYRKKYGNENYADVSETVKAYKNVLDDWDNISEAYGKFNSGEEYSNGITRLSELTRELVEKDSKYTDDYWRSLHDEIVARESENAESVWDRTKIDNRAWGMVQEQMRAWEKEKEEIEKEIRLLSGVRDATWKDVFTSSFSRGYNSSKFGDESFNKMWGMENEADSTNELLQSDKYQFAADGDLKEGVSGALEQFGQWAYMLSKPDTALKVGGAAAAGAGTAFVIGQAGPQIALPEEFATVPAGAITGFKAGMTAVSAENALRVEAGHAYNEMIENGISHETAKAIAMGVGTVNAALEFVQTDRLLDAFKVLNKSGTTQTVAQKIYKELRDRSVDVAIETAQEVAQEGTTLVGIDIARGIEGKDAIYSWGEVGERLGDTAESSLLSFGMMNVPATVTNIATDATRPIRVQHEAEKAYATDVKGDEEALTALIEEGKEIGGKSAQAATAIETSQANGKKVTTSQIERLIKANDKAEQTAPTTLEEAAQGAVERKNKADGYTLLENWRRGRMDASTLDVLTENGVEITADNVKNVTGFGDEGAKLVAHYANAEGATFSKVMEEVKSSYQTGFDNPDLDVKKGKGAFISPAQVDAFTAGQMDRKADDFATQERFKNAVVNMKSGFLKDNLPSDVTKTEYKILDGLYKAFGVKGYIAEGLKGNAEYNRGTAEAPISSTFEREVSGQKVSIVFHGAHEVAMHRLRDLAPDEASAFMHALYKHLAGNEPSAYTLADQKRDAYGKQNVDISLAEAREEISANKILYLYNNNETKFYNAIERIANGTDTKAKQGLRKFIEILNDILRKIGEFLKGMSADERAKAQAEVNEIRQLRDMFETAFAKAVENKKTVEAKAQTKQTAEAQKNTDTEGGRGGKSFALSDSKSGRANDLLLPYNEELTGFIRQRGDYIVSSFEGLKNVVYDAFHNRQKQATAYFGIIPSEIIAKIEKSIPNLPRALNGTLFKTDGGYSIATTLDSIRHLQDDKSLTEDDIIDYLDRMADTIVEFDTVAFDYYYESGNKLNGLLFKKAFGDGVLTSFEIVSRKKRSLNLQTFYMQKGDYKKKKSADSTLLERNPTANVQDEERSNFNNKIPQNSKSVKKDFSLKDSEGAGRVQDKQNTDTNSSQNLEIKKNEQYNGSVSHSLKDKYWRTDLNKTQFKELEESLRRIDNHEPKRIADTVGCWYKGRIDGEALFAIYSTETPENPTILYERKGDGGSFELDILLNLMEEIENGESVDGKSAYVNWVSGGSWLPMVNSSQNNPGNMGGGGHNQNAGVLPRQSQRNGSRAFWNVIENLRRTEQKRYSLKGSDDTAFKATRAKQSAETKVETSMEGETKAAFSLKSLGYADRTFDFDVTQADINLYIENAYLNANEKSYIKFLRVGNDLIDDVSPDVDITGFSHALRDNDIRHIKNSHGKKTNEKYPVTEEDIELIPYVVENYDKVFYKTNANGAPGLIYIKVMPGDVIYYVEAITTEYNGEKLLVNKQMVKTGIDSIPNLYGLIDAINKKQSSSQYLADLNEIRKAYVQDVKENYSKNNISQQPNSVKSNFSLKGVKSPTKEEWSGFVRAVEGLQSGKNGASKTLAKYVDSGLIRTELYDELIGKYGSIPSGEKPHRDIQVPKKTAKNKKVSQTIRTILEAEATPDAVLPTIEKMVEDGVFSYDVYTDKKAIKDAEDYLNAHGWKTTLDDWKKDVEKGVVSKQHTVTGWALYNNAVNRAETTTSESERQEAMQTALEVLDGMVRHQRSAAQALQATRVLKKLDPEVQLYGVAKSVQAFQKELTDKYGKKAPELKINEELAEKFLNAKTEEERADAEMEIYKDIGRQMPSTFADKWNAWRYVAMLANVRTHVRNIFGNAFFVPVVLTKDLIATGIESVVANRYAKNGKTMLRGKAIVFGSEADKSLLKAAWDDYANVADIISGEGKYGDNAVKKKGIEEGREIFTGWLKPVEWVRRKNSELLEKEDMLFSKPHYAYALAQYCKANNITAEQIKRGKAIAPAREYAIKEAQKATYRDTNAFSQFVSSLGRGGEIEHVPKVASMAVEGVLPFRKTPANILVRGVEYSPIGLLKGLTYDLEQVQKGKMETHEAIDNISAGLTGTGLLALGVLLAAQGLIRGHGEEDKDEKAFKEMMGHQSYALELPNGQSITLDWLAPEALPFFVGVNIWEATKGAKEEVNLSTVLKAVSSISEPMLEMSCLQSLNDLSESVGYATSNDTSGLVTILSSAATSYLTQGIPTLLGQAERTGEENRMTTYTEKNAFLTGDMQYTIGKASAKIPFWDYQQIPYIDAWGRKEASGVALKRGFNNFLNPAYTSTVEESKMEKELLRLFEKTGESSVFPKRADKYFTVDGKRKDLTADEYVRYATLKGEKSHSAVTSLVNSNAYKKLTDSEKVKAIEDAYDYANQKAKKAISSGYKTDTWVSTADAFGTNVGNFLSFRSEVSNTKQESGGKLSKQDVVDIVIDMAQNDSEAWKMYLSMYDSTSDAYAYDNGIAGGTYMSFLESLNDVDTPTDSGKFGTYTQKEATNAINQLEGLSRDEKAILWQSVNQNWKAKNNPFR